MTISREQYAQAFENGCFKAFIAIDDEVLLKQSFFFTNEKK